MINTEFPEVRAIQAWVAGYAVSPQVPEFPEVRAIQAWVAGYAVSPQVQPDSKIFP
jgi:hypothetical protein